MKFGGTSVGSAARFAVCAEIIDKTRKASPAPVVVLSAMAGITNQLIEGAESARERNLEAALKCLEGIRQRHIETVNELFQDEDVREDLYKTINDQLADLEILYRGVSYLGELTRRSLDMISSFGELLSTRIMAQVSQRPGHQDIMAGRSRLPDYRRVLRQRLAAHGDHPLENKRSRPSRGCCRQGRSHPGLHRSDL
ncbi:MAG: hypothetical protein IPM23_26560 [Candidatus Melainabacteria bacterium]|nr:hypothetical protein [Candidatus Melainabacteria bacterium]